MSDQNTSQETVVTEEEPVVEEIIEEVIVEEEVVEPEPQAQPAAPEEPRPDVFWGLGRRKTAVARVAMRNGSGKMIINGRPLEDYFPLPRWQGAVIAPLKCAGMRDRFDITVNLNGGGPSSQAGAVKLGIARALVEYNHDLMEDLRHGGLLTRDSRMKERKKPGQKGARKRFQFSKR